MAFAIFKLPDEPIVIIKFAGPSAQFEDTLASLYAQIDRLAGDNQQQKLHCIEDVSAIEDMCFSDILVWLDENRLARPGSPHDRRICNHIVGNHMLIDLWVKKAREEVRVHYQTHPTQQDAISAARDAIATDTASPAS